MAADGGDVGPVPAGPAVGAGPGIDEVQRVAHAVGAVQAQLGGDDALGVGLLLNGIMSETNEKFL